MMWAVETPSCYLGLDLGQSQDYTALCILEEACWIPSGPTAFAQGWAPDGASGWVSRDRLAPAQWEHWRERAARDGRPPHPVLQVRHLARLPLNTSYPDVVRHVQGLLASGALAGTWPVLVVDATGCGRPVVDMLRAAQLAPIAVTITAGNTTTYIRDEHSYRTPKKDLVATMAVLLEQRRLQIAEGLSEAATLRHELQAFKRRVTPQGDDTYSSWRERDHDDLVLATALACWYREFHNGRLEQAYAERERSPA